MIRIEIDELMMTITVSNPGTEETFTEPLDFVTNYMLIQRIHDKFYDKEKDIFNLPGNAIKQGTEVGIK